MSNQNLFNALRNVCGFIALETDMQEILNAVEKDSNERTAPICSCCGSDKTYYTNAVHCSRCAVTIII